MVGDPWEPVPGVAAATLTAVESVIRALPPHPVTLTVLAPDDDVELYVTFSEPPRTALNLTRTGQRHPRGGVLASRRDGRRDRCGMPGGLLAEGTGGMTGVIDVAAVDDHPIVLYGVAAWVMAAESDIRVIGTAATVDALLAGPGRHAHVVLLDLDLADGTAAGRNVAAILEAGPAVLVLSVSDKPAAVRAAMRAGALGYVLKNEPTAQIRAAIKAVAAGNAWISPHLAYILATDDDADRPVLSHQETRALQLYATGIPMKLVARKMTISEETAKQYLGRVREKYSRAGRAAPTKLELYYRAVEDGHLPPLP